MAPTDPADNLEAALVACAACEIGEFDVDPGCAAYKAFSAFKRELPPRSDWSTAFLRIGLAQLAHRSPVVRMLAAHTATVDLPRAVTAILAQAALETEPKVVRALWTLARGPQTTGTPMELRRQAVRALESPNDPLVQVAAVVALDPPADTTILLSALIRAAEPARAMACEKLYALDSTVFGPKGNAKGARGADPLDDPALPSTIAVGCLTGAAKRLCAPDMGDARAASAAVFRHFRLQPRTASAPHWQLVSAVACAKNLSLAAQTAVASALRPVVDDQLASGLARAEAVRTLALLQAPRPWFAAWHRRYRDADFGADGQVRRALQAVDRF
ncbi:MAG: hypothetical protein EXR77_06915 [Myxococcales bacterium]|nr:hypothetical protein [Myxococcales bacterium]